VEKELNMNEVISTITSLVLIFLYPVISGPVAAFVYIKILKRKEHWLRYLFWPVLIIVNIAGFFLLLYTLGDFMFGPGFLACLITPIVAVGTALGLRLFSPRFYQEVDRDPGQKRWYLMGTFFIPLMQLGTVFILILLAPSR
jgi:hypothetical protein